ncbi:MAG: hypothetical protein QM768_13925 [Agriterribacter sp.]
MKKLCAAAVVMVFISCSGNTSSDKYIKENAADSVDTMMKSDSSKPKDTLYPATDTGSYRKGTPKPVDTAK